MVTNSFGNRNFMQPIGRLSMHSKCLALFSFKFWVWGEGRMFSFFLCSQHVPPLKFSMGSHQVPSMFPRFSMCCPMVFPIAPHFNPICFAESPPLLTYRMAGHSIFPLKLLYLGSLHSFNVFFLLWANQIGSLQKKKSWPCDTPQLINMKQNKYPQLNRYYVPKFLPLPLTQAKPGDKQFWK
jgi:hypothetical protein